MMGSVRVEMGVFAVVRWISWFCGVVGWFATVMGWFSFVSVEIVEFSCRVCVVVSDIVEGVLVFWIVTFSRGIERVPLIS